MAEKPNAAMLRVAFWEAMKRCDNDERVHAMDMPCFSRTLKDSLVDGYLPDVLWEHMEAALSELIPTEDGTYKVGRRMIFGAKSDEPA